jgi:hypothetical protein
LGSLTESFANSTTANTEHFGSSPSNPSSALDGHGFFVRSQTYCLDCLKGDPGYAHHG